MSATAGEVVKTLRTRAGLSQAEVAIALKVSDGAIAHWENGRAHPRRDVAYRLDQLLGADGAVLGAFGYALPTNAPSTLEQLAERVTQLEERLARVEGLRASPPAPRQLRSAASADPGRKGRPGRPTRPTGVPEQPDD